jgi:hypothetical protein
MARTKKDSWIQTVEVDQIKIQRAIGYVVASRLYNALSTHHSIPLAVEEFKLEPVEAALLTIEISEMFDSAEPALEQVEVVSIDSEIVSLGAVGNAARLDELGANFSKDTMNNTILESGSKAKKVKEVV